MAGKQANWYTRQVVSLKEELQAVGSRTADQALRRTTLGPADVPQHYPELDRLFGEIDVVVTAVFDRNSSASQGVWHTAEERAIITRLGSIAAVRTQLDFYYRVASGPGIRTVCEIGFNAGHSAALWLSASPSIRCAGSHIHGAGTCELRC
jgi:hypothetical protein